jgi:hypothetical protein
MASFWSFAAPPPSGSANYLEQQLNRFENQAGLSRLNNFTS